MATGLVAGTYFAFTCAVMPGLAATDDRTFVAAMQAINVKIENPVFFAGFFGAFVLPLIAVFRQRKAGGGAALRWTIAGLALYTARVAHHDGLQHSAQQHPQGRGRRRGTRRPGGGAAGLRGPVGGLEHRPHGGVDGGGRLPGVRDAAARARRGRVVNRPRTPGGCPPRSASGRSWAACLRTATVMLRHPYSGFSGVADEFAGGHQDVRFAKAGDDVGHGLGRTDEIDVSMLHAPANDPARTTQRFVARGGAAGAAFG
ncbi:hypothetical protein ACU686_21005 [Yinghuangia aomiensis]